MLPGARFRRMLAWLHVWGRLLLNPPRPRPAFSASTCRRQTAGSASPAARREGDGYRLSGSKCFISNAGAAEFIVVYAKTDPDARGVSDFVVEPKITAGIDIAPAERTMGLRGGHAFGISLDCHVPEENRIGAEGSGFRTAMKVLDNGRIEVAAQATRIAAAALDLAVAYAKERRAGGLPIADFQGLQWMLADSANDLAAARALGYAAARVRAIPPKAPMPSSSPPRRPAASPTGRCRVVAATTIAAIFRWNAIRGLSGSSASTRAVRKSGARSLPADCSAEQEPGPIEGGKPTYARRSSSSLAG